MGVREAKEKCQALGSEWRAMTEVDSPRFAVGLRPAFRELWSISGIFLVPV